MRKRRTRQHVIADLGVNFVEKQVLLAGFTLLRETSDYGFDGYIRTFNELGEIEEGSISVQVKSTDTPKIDASAEAILFDLAERDLSLWLKSPNLTILVLYNAKGDSGYFLELQDYFKAHRADLKNVRNFVRVSIPMNQKLTAAAVHHLRNLKTSSGFDL